MRGAGAEHSVDHGPNLLLRGPPVAGDRLLDRGRGVLDDLQAGPGEHCEDHSPGVCQLKRGARVGSVKGRLDRGTGRMNVADDRFQLAVQAQEALGQGSFATYSKAELQALGEVIARHPRLLVMSDEIYEQIYYADDPFVSFAAACPELSERTVIVNGVAKAYAMTGWRIGYAAVPKALAKVMGKIQSQSTSNPCSVSQAAAIEALTGPQNFVKSSREEYRARRDEVIAGLASIPGVEIIEPSGAFYAFPCIKSFIGRRAPNGRVMQTDSDLTTYLLHEGKVAGVQGAAFGLSPYLRISYALSRADLRTAVERIRDALGALD